MHAAGAESRVAPSEKTRPWIARADLERGVWQAAGWTLTSVLPHRADRAVIAAAHALRRRTNSAELKAIARRISDALPEHYSPPQAAALAEEWFARSTELSWGRLRELHRTGWRIRVDLEGAEHLNRALERGRGVVVWFSSFCDSAILMRALAENGTRLSHLSAERHGAPARSRFGIRYVAPVYWSVEQRYLAERIVMRNPASPGYVRQVREALAANRAVSVRGDLAHNASHPSTFLGRPCRFTTGGPRMAHATQAPLVTSATVRLGPGHYKVIIDEELQLPERRRDFVEEAVAEYARRLARRVGENPADWEGWRWIDQLVVPS